MNSTDRYNIGIHLLYRALTTGDRRWLDAMPKENEMTDKAKHTPGPWTLGADGGLTLRREGACDDVAHYYSNEIMQLPPDLTMANAKLIAAAPDLLEACEAALDEVWDGETLAVKDALSLSQIRDKCRAAIAKARMAD